MMTFLSVLLSAIALFFGWIFLRIYFLRRKHKAWHNNPHLVKGLIRLRGIGGNRYFPNVYVEKKWKLKDGRIFYPATNGMYGCDGEDLITVDELIALLEADNPGTMNLGEIKMDKSAQEVQGLLVFHKHHNPYTGTFSKEVETFLFKSRM